ncbi:MAG TPA: 2Fe-2S iron-sulfur cluster-binding protein [Steroidobacteraceae bacterium]
MLRFHPLTLSARSRTADDAVHITFDVPAELRDDYRFEAGQHVAVRALLDGVEQRRTYSIINPPGSGRLELGIRVQSQGAMSRFLAERVRVGDTIEVLTPNGSFHPAAEPGRARWCVAFASGSGISPVLSIAATVLEREPLSRFQLFYGNTSIARTMFVDELMALKNRYLTRLSVHFIMSREPQDLEVFNGRLDSAKVRELARGMFDPGSVDEYFICGPGSMIHDIQGVLAELGVKARVHAEHFTAEGETAAHAASVTAETTPGPRPVAAPSPVPAASADATIATVTVIMDGRRRTFPVTASDEFVLDAAGRAGLDLPYSCRAGVCSTCRAKLVRGTVELENNVALEDWELEAGYILCCQARPTSPELEITYDQ